MKLKFKITLLGCIVIKPCNKNIMQLKRNEYVPKNFTKMIGISLFVEIEHGPRGNATVAVYKGFNRKKKKNF